MLPFSWEIFTSYGIAFMGPFTKFKNYVTVLVVVNKEVGYCWLIRTTVKATAVSNLELLQNYIVTPYCVPILIVSDSDPQFTSRFGSRL